MSETDFNREVVDDFKKRVHEAKMCDPETCPICKDTLTMSVKKEEPKWITKLRSGIGLDDFVLASELRAELAEKVRDLDISDFYCDDVCHCSTGTAQERRDTQIITIIKGSKG